MKNEDKFIHLIEGNAQFANIIPILKDIPLRDALPVTVEVKHVETPWGINESLFIAHLREMITNILKNSVFDNNKQVMKALLKSGLTNVDVMSPNDEMKYDITDAFFAKFKCMLEEEERKKLGAQCATAIETALDNDVCPLVVIQTDDVYLGMAVLSSVTDIKNFAFSYESFEDAVACKRTTCDGDYTVFDGLFETADALLDFQSLCVKRHKSHVKIAFVNGMVTARIPSSQVVKIASTQKTFNKYIENIYKPVYHGVQITTTQLIKRYMKNNKLWKLKKCTSASQIDAVLKTNSAYMFDDFAKYVGYNAEEFNVEVLDRCPKAAAFMLTSCRLNKDGVLMEKENKQMFEELREMPAFKEEHKAETGGNKKQVTKSLNYFEKLNSDLKKVIKGQNEAIDKITDALIINESGLLKHEGPVAKMLFVGPTGTGKTETARQLSRFTGRKLVRLNMNEYTDVTSVSKLFGTGAGYVGYDDGSLLLKLIGTDTNCILLLDEFEKAHHSVIDAIMNVIETGKIKAGNGEEADIKDSIIIATSNAGASELVSKSMGFNSVSSVDARGEDGLSGCIKKALETTFKRELLNRFDSIVQFNGITVGVATSITKNMLSEVTKMSNGRLRFGKECAPWLAEKFTTEEYGARELNRSMKTVFLTQASKMLIDKRRKGNILVTVKNDDVSFSFTEKGEK